MRLEGKNAVVTGGATGIGRAIALAFASEGASVVVIDLNSEGSENTTNLIKNQGGTAFSAVADISDFDQVKEATKIIENKFGVVDVLSNNAGSRVISSFLDHTYEDWRRMLDVNLTGHFLVCKALVPIMIKAGGGHIINTCSIASIQGRPNRIGYCAAKGGFLTFTKALSADLSDKNIRVNALAPAMIETPMNESLAKDPKFGSSWNSENLVGRWGQPDDVAKAALFLASSDSDFITGTTIHVDGGATSVYLRAGEMT